MATTSQTQAVPAIRAAAVHPAPAAAVAPGSPQAIEPGETSGSDRAGVPAVPAAPADAGDFAGPPAAQADVPKGPSPGEHYREIQRQRAALGRQLAQLRSEEERVAQDRRTLAADAELARKDPVGFATKHAGLTPEQLIERIAQGETAVAEEEAKQSELERKVAELEERDKRREADAAAKAQAAVIGQFKDRLTQHLAAHAERYPLIAPVAEFLGHAPADLVYAVMDLHYQRTAGPDGNNGELLEFDQACERIDSHYRTRAERFLKAPPIQARYRQTTDGAPGAAAAGSPPPGSDPGGTHPAGGNPGGPSRAPDPSGPRPNSGHPAASTAAAGGPSRAPDPSGPRPNPGSPAASPSAGGSARAPDPLGPRPTTLNNALDSAPAVTGTGVPRRARGRLAIDDAIRLASSRRPS